MNLDRPFVTGPQVSARICNWYGGNAGSLQHSLRGAAVFLCCGGPSLNDVDLSLLDRRGIVVATVNQVAATHCRPRFAFLVDPPRKFHGAIWRDPDICKFTRRELSRDRWTAEWGHFPGPHGQSELRIKRHGDVVRDLPNVWFFEPAYGFRPQTFLATDRIAWGADYRRSPQHRVRGTRSVMLVALRLLHWLGARTVFLVGADFRMQAGQSYAFDDPKNDQAAGTNNNSYAILNGWFRQLRPHFEAVDYRVVNVTPESRLDAFERLEFRAAVELAAGIVPTVDSVRGLYRL